jgi:hypothetical protein
MDTPHTLITDVVVTGKKFIAAVVVTPAIKLSPVSTTTPAITENP